jgi:hypothetical protein
MHLLIIGGSDAGISAALRAQELDPGAEVTLTVADAVALFHEAAVEDLNDLDLSYIPPFSSPWDPVQMARSELGCCPRAMRHTVSLVRIDRPTRG